MNRITNNSNLDQDYFFGKHVHFCFVFKNGVLGWRCTCFQQNVCISTSCVHFEVHTSSEIDAIQDAIH